MTTDKQNKIDEIISIGLTGIDNAFTTPDQMKDWLSFMGRFYQYSSRNATLIKNQFRGAIAVGSFNFFADNGFSVNKGEKAIKILAPNTAQDYFFNEENEKVPVKKANDKEKVLIKRDKIKIHKGKMFYNAVNVFDISQTTATAQDLPKLYPNKWLDGELKDYDLMYKAFKKIADNMNVKIINPDPEERELGTTKGYYDPLYERIGLNPRNSQLQNVKTLLHELTHAKLHNHDSLTRPQKEFQAEMVAFSVCSYFGIDTSEYSFDYLHNWTENKEFKEKEQLLVDVQNTTKEFIVAVENEITLEKERNKKMMSIHERYELAKNPSTPVELLEELAKDDEGYVREVALEELLKDVNIQRLVAGIENTPPEVLVHLSKSKDFFVRLLIAENEKSPLEALLELSNDQKESVRGMVAKNRSTDKDIISKLARDESIDVQRAVALNPNTSKEDLSVLAESLDEFTREKVALNPNTPPEVLQELANNMSEIELEDEEMEI